MGDNFTGREHDHDVLENEGLVKEVIDNLNRIATADVSAAYGEIEAAVNALNNVKGLSEYVGTVNVSEIESIFTGEGGVTESIKALATAMQSSADSIKEYDESEWYEKAGSTILMSLCKVGEGLLSIVEDVGDGLLTIGGTVAGIWGGEKWFEDAIKSEWSHDVFNGYYNSDLAKKSRWTEDSGVSGAFKIAGTTAGYIALTTVGGGYLSGLGAATTFASSTTIANTSLAVLTGLGSGEESGLRQGKGFYEALLTNALPQGAIQGLVAFAAEKVGENITGRTAAVKTAKSDLSSAKEAFSEADDVFAQATKAKTAAAEKLSKASGAAEKKTAQEAYDQANKTWLDAAAKRSGAYDDILSAESKLKSVKLMDRPQSAEKLYNSSEKIGTKAREAASETYHNSIAKGNNKFISGVKATGSGAKTTVKESLSGLNPFKKFGKHATTVENAASASSAVNTVSKEIIPITNAPTSAISSAAPTLTVSSAAPTLTVSSAAPTLAASAAEVPGVASAWLNSGGREISNNIGMNAIRNDSTYNVSAVPEKPYTLNETSAVDKAMTSNFTGGSVPSSEPSSEPAPSPSQIDTSSSDGSSSSGRNIGSSSSGRNIGSSSSGTSNGGSTSGNSSSGNYAPTSSTPKSTDTPTTQLKKEDPVTEVPKTETPTPTPAVTPQTTPTPVEAQQETPAATVVEVPQYGGEQTTYHTGGGYSGEGYYQDVMGETPTDLDTSTLNPLDETLLDNTTSIDEIVKGSKYTKIPTSSKPITTTTSTGSGSSAVIPIAAGLSAAAAAGIGAKAYMDRKKNNDVDDEDDDFETEEWSGDEESNGVDYDESSDTQSYLDEDDEYSYPTEPEEKYGARSSEELADLQ